MRQQFLAHGETAHGREHEVEDHGIRSIRLKQAERLEAVTGRLHTEAGEQ